MSAHRRNIVGLVPAAGQGSRVAPLPVSKELYPVGFGPVKGKQGLRPKVAVQYLLERMQLAGAGKAFVILRKGKWDIPGYLGDGRDQDMHLAYLMMRRSFGVPYTLDQAYPFIRQAHIVFGFPDIIFFPRNAYVRLLEQLTADGADIAVGLFRVESRPEKMDMVELDARDRIRRIDIKPRHTRLTHTWIAAAWTPVFTEFMHQFLTRDASARVQTGDEKMQPPGELYMGDIIRAGIEADINTTTVRFDSGRFLDIGTPEDIIACEAFLRKERDNTG